MADFVFRGVKAREAIEFIRNKKLIPTERFDQWMGSANAKGFVVAGATQMALLEDLYNAAAKAKEDGKSIGWFREQFAESVNRHGWSYNGEEGWRARTIYQNNMRTASMAGRWQQIQENKKAFPYLVYMTVGDENVRADHRRWHYICLPVDDPFWDLFYPPNGWGCRCYVLQLSEKQLDRMGIQVSDSPDVPTSERVIRSTGQVYGDVPDGIDTGWEYNVGKAWKGPEDSFAAQLYRLPKKLRQTAEDHFNRSLAKREINDAWKVWLEMTARQDNPTGSSFVIGWLDPRTIEALDKPPVNLAILVQDNQTNHLQGQHKSDKDADAPAEILQNLPALLAAATAVLKHMKSGNVVYVLPSEGAKKARLVVSIDFSRKGRKINSVRSIGMVDVKNLRQKDYEILWGDLK